MFKRFRRAPRGQDAPASHQPHRDIGTSLQVCPQAAFFLTRAPGSRG